MDQAKGLRSYFMNDKRQHILSLQKQVRQLIIQKKEQVEINAALIALEEAWIAFERENNEAALSH
ncbi:hypothetical protein GLP30_12765 [Photobacterium phosphoreum]|jgi:putative heme iron utilization protein|uniref:Flagellar export protein FliJ n=1 Tax=Photobacterium phosphoreum TaxID=659 RepID=A0AAW4ZQ80_PHOPO|nr:hypothetical protein [Photobacterium phosphoreum]KJF85538.1 hypothetical protein UB41_14885 [Photobacterium phosphoreum]MCD9463820.1 hypothetical protein [Photobacterium phosphoreum]MCD9471616.1 hypothetical protein [Photobacterium phosphoreum]MCD9475270.1 hypothetical protein [Photobacterium phosphoreum]MCD9478524.1 hypothetical protein [Photobacterium phosphoreum]